MEHGHLVLLVLALLKTLVLAPQLLSQMQHFMLLVILRQLEMSMLQGQSHMKMSRM